MVQCAFATSHKFAAARSPAPCICGLDSYTALLIAPTLNCRRLGGGDNTGGAFVGVRGVGRRRERVVDLMMPPPHLPPPLPPQQQKQSQLIFIACVPFACIPCTCTCPFDVRKYLLHCSLYTGFSVVRACRNFCISLVCTPCSEFFVARGCTKIYPHTEHITFFSSHARNRNAWFF